MEEYPSPAEGIGLENRQAGHTARGFESLFLRHIVNFILFDEMGTVQETFGMITLHSFLLSRGGATSVTSLNKLRVVPTHQASLNKLVEEGTVDTYLSA